MHYQVENIENPSFPEKNSREFYELSLWQNCALKAATFLFHRKPLYKVFHQFSHFFEFDVVPIAAEMNAEKIHINISEDRKDSLVISIGGRTEIPSPLDSRMIGEFLAGIGVLHLELDARLEQNQILDVFVFLHYCRKQIQQFSRGRKVSRIIRHLMEEGLHLACTQTMIHNEILIVCYSYCTLRYSRLVHWYEKRQTAFRDHRAIFRSAPRFAAFFCALVLGGGVLYAALKQEWYLVILLLSAGILLYCMIYLLFMVVGSIEYDNEEKAYRLNRAFRQLSHYTSKIQSDIQRASIIQQKLLPDINQLPFQDSILWATHYTPAVEVGGDTFDVQQIDDHRVVVFFSDVSGHGMGAALITAVIKTSFQACLDRNVEMQEIIQYLNLNLCRLTPVGCFAATFLAICDMNTRQLVYCNAGHQPEPWFIPGDSGRAIRKLDDAGFLLLGIEENYNSGYSYCDMSPGDKVVIVSDGIVESCDPQGNIFGIERMEALLDKNRHCLPADLVAKIVENFTQFSQDEEYLDDRTILVFEIKPN
jgi:sigma-B regulation protein RsbU (phosphoserine phosphatase)